MGNQNKKIVLQSTQRLIVIDDAQKKTLMLNQLPVFPHGYDGLHIWEAGIVLARYILYNSDQFANKRVLELGSGVGIGGLSVLKFTTCRDCVMSDYVTQILENIKTNTIKNKVEKTSTIVQLNWLEHEKTTFTQKFDIVIGSDIVYFGCPVVDLYKMIKKVLTNNGIAQIIIPDRKNYAQLFLQQIQANVFDVYKKKLEDPAYRQSPLPNKVEGLQQYNLLVDIDFYIYTLVRKGESNQEKHPITQVNQIQINKVQNSKLPQHQNVTQKELVSQTEKKEQPEKQTKMSHEMEEIRIQNDTYGGDQKEHELAKQYTLPKVDIQIVPKQEVEEQKTEIVQEHSAQIQVLTQVCEKKEQIVQQEIETIQLDNAPIEEPVQSVQTVEKKEEANPSNNAEQQYNQFQIQKLNPSNTEQNNQTPPVVEELSKETAKQVVQVAVQQSQDARQALDIEQQVEPQKAEETQKDSSETNEVPETTQSNTVQETIQQNAEEEHAPSLKKEQQIEAPKTLEQPVKAEGKKKNKKKNKNKNKKGEKKETQEEDQEEAQEDASN